MTIGELFHVVHVVDDLSQAEAWYQDVFGAGFMFRGHQSELDHRTASLMLFSDFPVEPMTPHAGAIGELGTIGKFRRRFGTRLHSLAFYCDSVGEGYERFRSFGVRVNGDGGATLTEAPTRGGIYSHPRDTYGLIELMEPRVDGRGGAPIGDTLGDCYDPRLLGAHDQTWWSQHHPLGILRTSCITVLVDDIDRAVRLYEQTLLATVVHESSKPRSVFVAVGPAAVIELRLPDPGTIEAAVMDVDGPMIWSATFLTRDLHAAAQHLAERGVRTTPREGLLSLDPGEAFGARYELTDQPIPGDPRG